MPNLAAESAGSSPVSYPQIKPEKQTASRWVDPFVARSKKRAPTEMASIFPQRQPIGLGRPTPAAEEQIDTLPVALNIPVHPDDEPVQTAETPRWTRRLSARNEPPEHPSRWRVSQPKPLTDDVETPPQPMPPQARRTPSPMPEVPRETVADTLLDAPTPSEAEPPALIDPPVAPASASESVMAPATPDVPEEANPPAEVPSLEQASETSPTRNLADEPDPLPATTPEPPVTKPDPFANEPDPLATAPAPEAASDVAPTEVAAAEPAEATESIPNPTLESLAAPPETAKPAEPVNLYEAEAAKAVEPEAATPAEAETAKPTDADDAAKSAEAEAAKPTEPDETATPAEPETATPAEPEAAKSAEPETAIPAVTTPSPEALTEPPPFVPTVEPETAPAEASEPEDGRFADPPPITLEPGPIDRSRLPRPPLPSPYMTAVPAASTADPATKRIATEVTETALKVKPRPKPERPARRTLWSRIHGEDHGDTPSLRDRQIPTPGVGLADMPPPQFLPSYYGQGATDSKRDEQTRKISDAPKPSPAKPSPGRWHFRLFRHLRGE